MKSKFRLSKTFAKNEELQFSPPTLVADGNDDVAYQTPFEKRHHESLVADSANVSAELTTSLTPQYNTLDPRISADLERELQDESTPLPSPVKSQNHLSYQKHRRNQSSVSLMQTYSNVPNYEIGEYQTAAPRTSPKYHVKIVVVGDGGCGKTCLLVSYSQGEFPTLYVPTVFENYVAHVTTPENEIVELALWDTAGQEEYDRLRPLSYPDADIFLICYSMDSPTSLTNVQQCWWPEVKYFCPGVPSILVGLKSDLYESNPLMRIDRRLTKSVCKEIGAIAHIECSAKTMFNVKTVFSLALYTVLKKLKRQDQLTAKRQSHHTKRSSVVRLSHHHDQHDDVSSEDGVKRKKCVIM